MNTDLNDNSDNEKEENRILTMVDFLAGENELEEDANLLLGGVDDKSCSYSKGYVFRQPLYACLTCSAVVHGKLGAVCLACSFHCHEQHDLVELYTKRFFRCDCGNSNFPNKCKLEPSKDEINERNKYNHNFRGTYCTCKRPYPDESFCDEMRQCIVCEDWYHKSHLKADFIPKEYDEVICQDCMAKHTFIWKYIDHSVEINETFAGQNSKELSLSKNKNDDETSENKEEAEGAVSDASCYLRGNATPIGTGATFWSYGWRKKLCKCEQCLKMYQEEDVLYLINESDTVQYFEAQNMRVTKETQYEKALSALSSLDRVQQVKAIQDYNDMKIELMEYFKKFVEQNKVVKVEDIHAFFKEMKAKKKADVVIPYYCR